MTVSEDRRSRMGKFLRDLSDLMEWWCEDGMKRKILETRNRPQAWSGYREIRNDTMKILNFILFSLVLVWVMVAVGCARNPACCSSPASNMSLLSAPATRVNHESEFVQNQNCAFSTDYLEKSMAEINLQQIFKIKSDAPDWRQLIVVARVIQTNSPRDVENVLNQFQMRGIVNGNFQHLNLERAAEDEKLFLLMRVVFQLPESVPFDEKPFVYFGGWAGRWAGTNGVTNPDGTVNLDWPIRWQDGHPEIYGEFLGFEGIDARYCAAHEYAFFLRNYPMRHLKEN